MEYIDNIKFQFEKEMKFRNRDMTSLSFVPIHTDRSIIKLLYNGKFVVYINMANFTEADLIAPISKKWVEYRNNIVSYLIKHIENCSINYDTVCIIPVHKNHNKNYMISTL